MRAFIRWLTRPVDSHLEVWVSLAAVVSYGRGSIGFWDMLAIMIAGGLLSQFIAWCAR